MKKSWETPSCNLCKKSSVNVVYDDLTYWEYEGKFRVVECTNCSLVFLSPRPGIKEIAKYYEVDNYFGRDITSIKDKHDEKKERDTSYAPVYELIESKFKKGSILDIGAGTGLLLSKFKDDGWKVDGVELTRDAVNYAKKHYGIALRKGDFFNFKFKDNSFDVVTLSGALEHLYNPFETLVAVRKVLKKGGIVVFTVPNVAGFGRHIFGRDWFPWQPPRHLYHFSPKTAKAMLDKAGYKNIEIKHNYSLQNHYILFQSLRYSRSPKFEKKSTGGLAKKPSQKMSKPSLKVQFGKLAGEIMAHGLTTLEPVFKRGEVLIVSAQK